MKKYLPLLLTFALATTMAACDITQGTETPAPSETPIVTEIAPPTPTVEPTATVEPTPFVFPTPAVDALPLTSYYPEGLPSYITQTYLDKGVPGNPEWGGLMSDPELVIGVVNGTDVAYCAIPYGGAQSMPFDDTFYSVGDVGVEATGCANGVSLLPTPTLGIYTLDIGDGTSYSVSVDPAKLEGGTYFFAVRPEGFVADGAEIVTPALAEHLNRAASRTGHTLVQSGCPLVPTPSVPETQGSVPGNYDSLAVAVIPVTSRERYSLTLSQ